MPPNSKRGKTPKLRSPVSSQKRLPNVRAVSKPDGRTYFYFRVKGQPQIPLPSPEWSEAFLAAYETAKKALTVEASPDNPGLHTVNRAITAYLQSADYAELSPGSKDDYRRLLDRFREQFGDLHIAVMDPAWIERLRAKYAKIERPADWNALRSRMIQVARNYQTLYPKALQANHWRDSRRLQVGKSAQNRPWPPAVLGAVMRAATPEFRVLLICYLLTAQRGGDITALRREQYDPVARTLNLSQEKTDTPLLIHVPDALATVFERASQHDHGRLLETPRGKPWTTANAQETLARLLGILGLPRYTLHGLRATGPVALKMLGFENRAIRALTGHASDSNLETYLAGVEHYPLAREAQEALADHFGALLEEAAKGEANTRSYVGVTGRAAAKAKNRGGN